MKHILFIKFYALGDIITTLNFLESVKNKNFKISILTSNEYKFIYKDIFKFSGQIYLTKITNNLLNTALRILTSTIWFSKFDECWLGHRSFILALLILIVSRSKVIYFGERKFFNLIIPISFQKLESTDEILDFIQFRLLIKIFTYQFNQDEIKIF